MSDTRHPEYQYLDLCKDILENGADKELFFNDVVLKEYEEKGEKPPFIRSVFGRQIRFDLSEGFPLLTTKKTFWRGITTELLWFLSGSSNLKPLVDMNNHIWDEWAWKMYHMWAEEHAPEEDMTQEEFIEKIQSLPEDDPFVQKWGDLITIYGRMWRRWPAKDGREIDQLAWVIEGLKTKPDRKSYVVSAWNPDFIYAMASEGQKMLMQTHFFQTIVPLHRLLKKKKETMTVSPLSGLLLRNKKRRQDIPAGFFLRTIQIYAATLSS
jgi:thymidylate synthase